MPTLYIAGDSTAAQKGGGEKPMAGWGEFLQEHFSPKIAVDNRAVNGRSTRSFLAEGRLEDIGKDFRCGDYLLIQFGHNDQKVEDPARYTDPAAEYRRNLLTFIEFARSRGGYPVLLTSVSRRRFTAGGEPDPLAVGLYPEAVRETAAQTGTPLLDIFASSQQLYRELGVDGSRQLFMHLPAGGHPNYPQGITDDTHFCKQGAARVAELVVEAIPQSAELAALHAHLREPGFRAAESLPAT
ncbi:rhamnogalacturonan acetylesterase [Paenibacillus sonchi]|uniref:Rhamnogalacturonan acetylesterase n=1 Tax=Paenibacillus sonchi TaxID=373687 RepID=A0A974PCP1_9BACL|nr:rhamnogalacturonan acetylesterase [Paenibacillus sonchi]QQZ60953.1 rhamnogalacturonan acetylesterase [Paenibacillus sonchi]